MTSGQYWKFDPKTAGLERKARDALGRWTSAQAAVERVNHDAIKQMSEWAVEELSSHIRREEGPQGRTGKLERAILNPTSHSADKDGFKFLIAQKMIQQARYWRAIEHGSSHMVGRRMRLIFKSGGTFITPNPARGGSGVGPGAKGGLDSAFIGKAGPFVTIHRPIVGYHYGQAAVNRFMLNDKRWYRDATDKEFERSGLAPTKKPGSRR